MRRWSPSASAGTRPSIRRAARAAADTPFAIGGYPKPTKSALDVPEEERNAAYEAKWQEGGSISYLYAYTDLLVNKQSNDTASEFVRNKIRGIVKDQRTAELLAPKDHPIGTKRLCLDTDYYETYNRDNVTPGRRAQRSDRGDHRRRACAPTAARVRARRHRVRHRLRRHDRRAARDRRAHQRRAPCCAITGRAGRSPISA